MGEGEAVVEVVGSWDWEIEWWQRFWPAILKTEPHGLGIDLQFKMWARTVGETNLVRGKWSLRWWKAETGRSSGGGGFGLLY